MNRALTALENYDPDDGPVWSTGPAIELAIKELKRLIEVERRYDVLALHMAEVKAFADGNSTNSLSDIVDHCLKELNDV